MDHETSLQPMISNGFEEIEKTNESFLLNESAEVPSYDLSNVDLTKTSCDKKKRCRSKIKSGFEIKEIIKNDNLDVVEKCDEVSVNISNSIVRPDLSNSTTSQVPDSQSIPKNDLTKSEKVVVSVENTDVHIPQTKIDHIQSALQEVEIIENTEKDLDSSNDLLDDSEQKVDRDAVEDAIFDEKDNHKIVFSKEVEVTIQKEKDSDLTENFVSTADLSDSSISDETNSEEKDKKVKKQEAPIAIDSLVTLSSENTSIQNAKNDMDKEISTETNNQEVSHDDKLENVNTISTEFEKQYDISESPASPELEDQYPVDDIDISLEDKSNKENRDEELPSTVVHRLPVCTPNIERRRSKRILPNQDLILNAVENEKSNLLQFSEVKSPELSKRKRQVTKVSYKEDSEEEGEIVENTKTNRRYSFRSMDNSKVSSQEINPENSESTETNTIDLISPQKPIKKDSTESKISKKDLFDDDEEEEEEEEEGEIVDNTKSKCRYSFRSMDSSKAPYEDIDTEKSETNTIDLTRPQEPLEEDSVEIAPVTKRKRIIHPKNLFEPTEEKTDESEEQKPSSDVEEPCEECEELPVRKRRGRKPTKPIDSRQNLMTKIKRLGRKTTRSSGLSFESKLAQNTDPMSFPVDSPKAVVKSEESPNPVVEVVNIGLTKKRIAHKPKLTDPSVQNDDASQVTKVLKKTRSSNAGKDSSETSDIISSLMDKFDETSKDRARVISTLRRSVPVPSPEPSLRLLNDISADKSSNEENNPKVGASAPRSLLKPLPFDTSAISAFLGKNNSFVGSNLGISPAFTASTLKNNSGVGAVPNAEISENSGVESDNDSNLNSTVTRVDNLIQDKEYNISTSLLSKNAKSGSEEKSESHFEPDDEHQTSLQNDLVSDGDGPMEKPSTSKCNFLIYFTLFLTFF